MYDGLNIGHAICAVYFGTLAIGYAIGVWFSFG